jgi:hypothetical protein
MGHLRLGRLPLRHNWSRVVEAAASPGATPSAVASATAAAAAGALGEAASSDEVAYPFWLLVQLAHKSRDDDGFERLIATLGIEYRAGASALQLAEQIAEHLRESITARSGHTAFAEAAVGAFQRTLLAVVQDQPRSLFEAESDDLRNALGRHATANGFGRLGREFLGAFFGSVLRIALSYTIADSIGGDRNSPSIASAEDFRRRLDTYTRDVSVLVQDFGAGWYSKNLWESGDISQEMAAGFLHVAFAKFRQQLQHEDA